MAKLHTHQVGVGGSGINPEGADIVLSDQWLSEATDVWYTKNGTLSQRPGTKYIGPPLATGGGSGSQPVEMWIFRTPAEQREYYQASSTGMYELVGGVWTATAIVAGSGGAYNPGLRVIPITFNGKSMIWQADSASSYLRHVQAASGGTWVEIATTAGPIPVPAAVLSAWGRLWVVDQSGNLTYSELLDETSWHNGTPGSNTIALEDVWPVPGDTIVSMVEHNGSLVLFGEKSIIIYGSPDQVAAGNMVKVEGLTGVGCRSAGSIQSIGDDVLFLTVQGLTSLGRTIQEKSMPIRPVAPHISDTISSLYPAWSWSAAQSIYSAYSPRHQVYYLTPGNGELMYAFDMSLGIANVRVTTHSIDSDFPKWYALGTGVLANDAEQQEVLVQAGRYDDADGEFGILRFTQDETQDFVSSAGSYTNAKPIRTMSFSTPWLDGGEDAEMLLKLLKSIRAVIVGGDNLVATLNIYYDYSTTVAVTRTVTVANTSVPHNVKWMGARAGQVYKLQISVANVNVATKLSRLAVNMTLGRSMR